MYPIQTNPDGSRVQWNGQQWVPLPPSPKDRRRLVGALAAVGVVVLAVVGVVRFRSDSGVLPASLPAVATTAAVTTTNAATGTSVVTPTSRPSVATTAVTPTTRPSSSPSTATTIPLASSVPVNPGAGTDPEAQLADDNFFVAALPALRSMPAPDWVSQGTRITYYSIAASVPNSYYRYVEDEEGNWTDPTTGKNYRREDIQSAAGHGYTEVNVAVLNDAIAALNVRAYGLTDLPLDSPVTTIAWSGVIGLPGAGSDYWLHPTVLAQVEEVVSDSLKIVRMPYTIGDRTFSSIWFQVLGDRGNYTWVYDLDSGILLHTASATQGPPITGPVAQNDSREGSTFLTQSTLVNVRDVTLPWVNDRAPSWIADVSHLDYTGTFSSSLDPSAIRLDLGLAVDRETVGNDWARWFFARTIYSTVAPSVTEYAERVDGVAQVDGLFLPPDTLAGLSAGDQLDSDPITQATVSVESVDPTSDGFTVTICESGPGETSYLTYDGNSGVLVASSYIDQHLGTRVDLQLASWS